MSRAFSALERTGAEACSSTAAPGRRPIHNSGVQRWPMGRAASLRGASAAAARRAAVVSRVMTPSRTNTEVTNLESALQPASPDSILSEVLAPVESNMNEMRQNLKNVVGKRHPMLMAAAEQIFGAGGKRLRPAIVFLVSYATQQLQGDSTISDRHKRLAEIMEMIHTASLVHDDVLDECDIRRGKETINSTYGTRVAVLAGDYLFAQSSWALANLENIEVIKLISQVIADFADGEISQATSLFNTEVTLQEYLDKSFYKTASLIAASCRSAAALSDVDETVKDAMYRYGKHLGLAFQIVDDILDFTQTTEQLGKPQGQDLASGNLTAPAIFALASETSPEGAAELLEIIESEFVEHDSHPRALQLVASTGGLSAAQQLARSEADKALHALEVLPEGQAKRSLQLMVDYILDRLY